MRASPQERRGRGRGGEAYSPSPPGASVPLSLASTQEGTTAQNSTGLQRTPSSPSSASSYSTTTEPSIPPPPLGRLRLPLLPPITFQGERRRPRGGFLFGLRLCCCKGPFGGSFPPSHLSRGKKMIGRERGRDFFFLPLYSDSLTHAPMGRKRTKVRDGLPCSPNS